jgi:hydroxyacylglutathione hydrolase
MNTIEEMIHEILPVGQLQCNCSVLGDPATGEALVIDPGDDLHLVHAVLQKHNLRVRDILITHAHLDHIGAAAVLRRESGAPLWLHELDQKLYDALPQQCAWLGVPVPEMAPIDHRLKEGETISFAGQQIEIRFVPGHAPGHVVFHLPQEKMLIAGDTLFRDGVGRWDLLFGNGPQLLRAIREQLFTLPDDTEVHPGHGASTTIGREKKHNPYFG